VCLLLRGGYRRPWVVRRLPDRRPCLFDPSCCCASLLKADLFTYVCTQILLLPLTLVYLSLCIRALEAPACNIKLVLFWFVSRVVLWYLPVSLWSWSCAFACMISARSSRGHHNYLCRLQTLDDDLFVARTGWRPF
jgi:hypothetical protein